MRVRALFSPYIYMSCSQSRSPRRATIVCSHGGDIAGFDGAMLSKRYAWHDHLPCMMGMGALGNLLRASRTVWAFYYDKQDRLREGVRSAGVWCGGSGNDLGKWARFSLQ